jgi:hypothetical protein
MPEVSHYSFPQTVFQNSNRLLVSLEHLAMDLTMVPTVRTTRSTTTWQRKIRKRVSTHRVFNSIKVLTGLLPQQCSLLVAT